ncbi:MAG: serine protease [Bdellovibrionales bacterium]|nr:serine protease [Bdellovibrionales bacterium]
MRKILIIFLVISFVNVSCSEEEPAPPSEPENASMTSTRNIPFLFLNHFLPQVIYGKDNRKDLYQIQDPLWLHRAQSTAALVRSRQLVFSAQEVELLTKSYGEEYQLCPEEPFREQETLAFCSGFLVGNDIMMTAGHCIRTPADCNNTYFVFGFSVFHEHTLIRKVPADKVFHCQSILKTHMEPKGSDFAIVRLDRPVTHTTPLSLRSQGVPQPGEDLTVIGHPSGLPTKIAQNGIIRSLENGFLVASLDTYGGNSGSAVFNSTSGEVEGILVRGETDYEMKKNCAVSHICKQEGCRGEDVTLISEAIKSWPD